MSSNVVVQYSNMYKRGALIVLEGCDRAGKSTQTKMLMNALNDLQISAKTEAFPSKLRQTACREIRLFYAGKRFFYREFEQIHQSTKHIEK